MNMDWAEQIIYLALTAYNLLLIGLVHYQIKNQKPLFDGAIVLFFITPLMFNFFLVQSIQIKAGIFYAVYFSSLAAEFAFCGFLIQVAKSRRKQNHGEEQNG